MMLMSSLSFVNKSLTISTFSFSTAKYNAVLKIIFYLILLKNMILNVIEWYDF